MYSLSAIVETTTLGTKVIMTEYLSSDIPDDTQVFVKNELMFSIVIVSAVAIQCAER